MTPRPISTTGMAQLESMLATVAREAPPPVDGEVAAVARAWLGLLLADPDGEWTLPGAPT